jgi:hypothetical protein
MFCENRHYWGTYRFRLQGGKRPLARAALALPKQTTVTRPTGRHMPEHGTLQQTYCSCFELSALYAANIRRNAKWHESNHRSISMRKMSSSKTMRRCINPVAHFPGKCYVERHEFQNGFYIIDVNALWRDNNATKSRRCRTWTDMYWMWCMMCGPYDERLKTNFLSILKINFWKHISTILFIYVCRLLQILRIYHLPIKASLLPQGLCKICGIHGGDSAECHLLGYKNPVRTPQETYYVSATELSRLILRKSWDLHGSDYEECRLLGYKTQFVPHRRHITSPLQSPAG